MVGLQYVLGLFVMTRIKNSAYNIAAIEQSSLLTSYFRCHIACIKPNVEQSLGILLVCRLRNRMQLKMAVRIKESRKIIRLLQKLLHNLILGWVCTSNTKLPR